MRIRTMKFSCRAVFLAAVIGGGASPVLADCCDSFWDCAATVVTYGVSCEVETIIDTIKNLMTVISNVKDIATGTTNSAVTAAKQWVSTTHDSYQTESQQAAATLSAAAAQAQTLYKEETTIRPLVSVAPVNTANITRANPTAASPPSGPAKPQTELLASRQGVAPAAAPAPSGNSLQRTTVIPATNMTTLQSTLPAPGSFAPEFEQGMKLIAGLQSATASDVPTINQDLARATQTEGVGEQSAQSIAANAINAPLDSIKNLLSSLLSDPTSAFDPSSQVQTVEDSVISQLSTNVGTMVDDVTNGPKAAFADLQPSLVQLVDGATQAQTIATAMDRAYRERTPAAVAALHALLPKTNYVGLTAKANSSASLNAKFANGLSYNDLLGRLAATKQNATAGISAKVQQFHAAATQLKAQLAQRKLAQSPSMLQTFRSKLTQQLSTAFDGKLPQAVNAQRDQLIAQARTHFSQDTKTQNAVIALLNSEAAKRTGTASTAVATPAMSATALGSSSNAMKPASAMKPAVPPRVTAVAPQASPLLPSAAPFGAPAGAPKATAWGSAPPAWAPPVSTSAAAKPPIAAAGLGALPAAPATNVQVQKLQPLKPAMAVQPAPSSLTHP